MSWDLVEKKTFGACHYPECWLTEPCVSLTKQGVSFNAPAVAAFGLKKGNGLIVLLDKKHRRVGFKSPASEFEEKNAYYLQGDNAPHRKSLLLASRAATKTFPDAVGRVFRLVLMPGQHVLAAELGPVPGTENAEAA